MRIARFQLSVWGAYIFASPSAPPLRSLRSFDSGSRYFVPGISATVSTTPDTLPYFSINPDTEIFCIQGRRNYHLPRSDYSHLARISFTNHCDRIGYSITPQLAHLNSFIMVAALASHGQ